MRRRDFLKTTALGGVAAGVGGVVFLRRAYAQNPIKIGLPTVLSGGNAQYGIQAKRACELFARDVKGKGILGRSSSSPAPCCRRRRWPCRPSVRSGRCC